MSRGRPRAAQRTALQQLRHSVGRHASRTGPAELTGSPAPDSKTPEELVGTQIPSVRAHGRHTDRSPTRTQTNLGASWESIWLMRKTMKLLGLFIFLVSPQHRTMTPEARGHPPLRNMFPSLHQQGQRQRPVCFMEHLGRRVS